jgi:hypothetical protein
METISERANVPILGHIPMLQNTSKESLKQIEPTVPFNKWFSTKFLS